MAQLTHSKLYTHPAGTINLGGLINGNWETLEAILSPDTTSGSPVFGVLWAAIRGQGIEVSTITYDGTDQVDMTGAQIQKLVLTGDSTIELTNLGVGRTVVLLLEASGATRNLTWDPAINWSGEAPTSIPSGEKRIVLLYSFGTTQGNVWAGVPGGGGGGGGGGAAGLLYQWNTDTATTDPGAGKLKVNNATLGTATELYISETDDDGNGVGNFLGAWDDGTSNQKGVLTIVDPADPTNFAIFELTGAITDNGTWRDIDCDLLASGGTLTNNLPVRITFARTGDKGDPGTAGPAGSTGLSYTFDTATSGDPGAGQVLFDNATLGSVTAVHVSETEASAVDVSGYLGTWDDSTSTVKGVLIVKNQDDPASFVVFSVTAASDPGAYRVFTVTPLASAGSFAASDPVSLEFIPVGDKGDTGTAGDSSIHVEYEGPTATTYTLMLYATRAGTIERLVTKTSAGTLTANVRINGVSVTSLSAVSVTSTESNTAASGANTFVEGDTIDIVATSVVGATNWLISLKIT